MHNLKSFSLLHVLLPTYVHTWASLLNPEEKKRTLPAEKCLYKLSGAMGRQLAPVPTSLCGWPGPGSAARRFRTCTSCGSPVVPLLAQPDKTVKLSIRAWTGWEALTGDSSHWVLGSGPAEAITNMNPSETAINCATIKLIVLDDRSYAGFPEKVILNPRGYFGNLWKHFACEILLEVCSWSMDQGGWTLPALNCPVTQWIVSCPT